jgi:hypothetical protein
MPDEALNPYAPPLESEVAADPPAGGWMVQGGYLLVRPGTALPPIALNGDGRDEHLTPGLRRFQVIKGGGKGLLVACLPSILGMAWFVYCKLNGFDHYAWIGLLAIILIARLSAGRAGGATSVTISGFFSVEELRRAKRKGRWTGPMMLVGLAFLFAAVGLLISGAEIEVPALGRIGGRDRVFSGFLLFVLIGLGLVVGAARWSQSLQGLRSQAFRDGWLYLTGVPPHALHKLSAKSIEPLPPPRMRKVSKFYQHRLPLSVLLRGQATHPWIALWLTIFKLSSSPRLVRLQFDWSERLPLPLEEADSDLTERWRKESAGTLMENWQLVMAERRDSPTNDLRMEFVTYASPDWTHFVSLVATRISAGHIYTEIYQGILQSWNADGRYHFTSNPPMAFLLPAYFDSVEVKGTLEAIYQAHLARTQTQELLPVSGTEHLTSLYEAQAKDIAALYESRGLQSPSEEMELRDLPA